MGYNIMTSINVNFEHWEEDEYVITLNGSPVGGTLHKDEAQKVCTWLKTAINEITLNIKGKE